MAEIKQKNKVSSETVFKTVASEEQIFYKSMMTIAGSAMGGSLLFIEKIASSPTPISFIFLAVSWTFLVITISLLFFIIHSSLESGRQALKGDYSKADNVDERNFRLRFFTICTMAVGILSLLAFGFLNIVS